MAHLRFKKTSDRSGRKFPRISEKTPIFFKICRAFWRISYPPSEVASLGGLEILKILNIYIDGP